MNPQQIILAELESHRGWMNALPRKKLLRALRLYDPEITDREMRKIKETTPGILSCERGYYLARQGWQGKEDCEKAIEYRKKKIFPEWKQIKKIETEHPEFFTEEKQRRLF